MRIVKFFGMGILVLLVIVGVGVLITQKVSDGPIEFLQGGSFKTGELIEAPVTDWSFAEGKSTEFELVGFGTSRTAGFIMHDGIAYMTCDLGFMWNRLPESMGKVLLRLIYTFKHWHTDAVMDGRALMRVEGKVYKSTFVKVENPVLERQLRMKLEELGREYFAPRELGPAPVEPPNDVWFFRMDP